MIIRREIRFVALQIPDLEPEDGNPCLIFPRHKIMLLPHNTDAPKYSLCEVGPSYQPNNPQPERIIYRRCRLPETNIMIDWRQWMWRIFIAYLKGPLYLEDFGVTETAHL